MVTDPQPRKGRPRRLTLWAPPVPSEAFEVKGAHAERIPTQEEIERNDEQVRRLEAALVAKQPRITVQR